MKRRGPRVVIFEELELKVQRTWGRLTPERVEKGPVFIRSEFKVKREGRGGVRVWLRFCRRV